MKNTGRERRESLREKGRRERKKKQK